MKIRTSTKVIEIFDDREFEELLIRKVFAVKKYHIIMLSQNNFKTHRDLVFSIQDSLKK